MQTVLRSSWQQQLLAGFDPNTVLEIVWKRIYQLCVYLGCHLDTICLNNKKGNKYFLYDMEEGVITLVLSVLSDYIAARRRIELPSPEVSLGQGCLLLSILLSLSLSLPTAGVIALLQRLGGSQLFPVVVCCLQEWKKGKAYRLTSIQITRHRSIHISVCKC